VSGWLREMTL